MLASSSPRRRAIMSALGLPYVVRVAAIEETPLPGEVPSATVERLALAKAAVVAQRSPERFLVGADTVVVLDGAILGKPADASQAGAMLRALRDREHDVVSGVAVLDRTSGRGAVGSLVTWVRMRAYSEEEITRYIASGEPLDKAGAYAIQDAVFRPVAGIRGCYLNVVGLPLCLLTYLLWEAGVVFPAPGHGRVGRLCPQCVLALP